VLKTALALLERESGPVLVDYLEEVPHGSDAMLENDMTGMVCPIDRPRILGVDPSASELGQARLAEIASFAPCYDLPVWTRGRTTMGPSGLDINDTAKFVAVLFVAAFRGDQEMPVPRVDLLKGCVLKFVDEDMKAYCTEAITAQPSYGVSLRVKNRLFNETVIGEFLWTLGGLWADFNAIAMMSITKISVAIRSCQTDRLILFSARPRSRSNPRQHPNKVYAEEPSLRHK
jgi:hypothetical protein